MIKCDSKEAGMGEWKVCREPCLVHSNGCKPSDEQLKVQETRRGIPVPLRVIELVPLLRGPRGDRLGLLRKALSHEGIQLASSKALQNMYMRALAIAVRVG